MSDDKPSSAAVHPVKRLAMKTRTDGATAPGEPLISTTEIDSQRLPQQDHPKGDPKAQKPWGCETADSCAKKPELRHCSENEVVEAEFAVSRSDATQLSESWETAVAALVRERRGEVRVSTLTANEKRELIGPSSGRSVQAATRKWTSQSTHAYEMGDCTQTRCNTESSLGRLGIHTSAAGSEIHCITDSIATWSSTLLDCGKITRNSLCRADAQTVFLHWSVGDHEHH